MTGNNGTGAKTNEEDGEKCDIDSLQYNKLGDIMNRRKIENEED